MAQGSLTSGSLRKHSLCCLSSASPALPSRFHTPPYAMSSQLPWGQEACATGEGPNGHREGPCPCGHHLRRPTQPSPRPAPRNRLSLPPLAEGEYDLVPSPPPPATASPRHYASPARAATPLYHADANDLLERPPSKWMETESFGGRTRPRVFRKASEKLTGPRSFFKTKSQPDLTALNEVDKLKDDIRGVAVRLDQRETSLDTLKAALELETSERQVGERATEVEVSLMREALSRARSEAEASASSVRGLSRQLSECQALLSSHAQSLRIADEKLEAQAESILSLRSERANIERRLRDLETIASRRSKIGCFSGK